MNHYNPAQPDLTAVLAAISAAPEYTALERVMFSMACTPDSVFIRDAAIRAEIAAASAHIASAIASVERARALSRDDCVIEQLDWFLLDAPGLVTNYLAEAASLNGVSA